MSSPWPTSLAISEGLANARTGRRLAASVTTVVALVTAGVGLANALDVSALVRAEQQWIDAGAFVFVVEPGASDSAGVDVAICDRLAAAEGIEASFAVQVTDATAEPANAPGTRATIARTSPGVYAFLGATEPPDVGVLVTSDNAARTGLIDGEATVFTVETHGTGQVSSVDATAVLVDATVLAESLSGTYLVPTDLTGPSSQCYVRTDAAHVEPVRDYLGSVLGGDDGAQAVVRPRLSETAHGIDFATAYRDRVLGWAWVAGAAVLVLLWSMAQWTRRTREAIYATFGARARARLIIQATEWLALSVVGLTWGWGIAMSFAIALGADIHVALVQVTANAGAIWCVASLGVLIVGLWPIGTLLDTLKDRS